MRAKFINEIQNFNKPESEENFKDDLLKKYSYNITFEYCDYPSIPDEDWKRAVSDLEEALEKVNARKISIEDNLSDFSGNIKILKTNLTFNEIIDIISEYSEPGYDPYLNGFFCFNQEQ